MRKDQKKSTTVSSVIAVIAEVLITCGVILALYIVWQLWWTGVEADQTQSSDTTVQSWTNPSKTSGSYKIAQAYSVDTTPVEDGNYSYAETIGKIYIPRFGSNWSRTIVEGTDSTQLARHGMGHYEQTQKIGEVGNFAIAGHRSGYGEPLAHVDTLQKGDYIIVRTNNYWYVYQYTSYELVDPSHTSVLNPVPNSGGTATERIITMTTCHPRYTTATKRWISYGKLVSWSKVSEGIPSQLATKSSSGSVSFTQEDSQDIVSKIPPLTTILLIALIAYAIVYLAAAVEWKYPAMRVHKKKLAEGKSMSFSIYGWIARLQPGIRVVRALLLAILFIAAVAVLFQWVYPWAATNIPYLRVSSNYVSVE